MPIQTDYSQRFTLEKLDIRGQLVQLTGSWQNLLRGRDYPADALAYLGEMMCVSVLVGAGLKHAGKVTLQVQGARGDGEHHAAKLVVVDCTHELGIRGMASFEGMVMAGSYSDWVRGGDFGDDGLSSGDGADVSKYCAGFRADRGGVF